MPADIQISIITPCYNLGEYLMEAIDSVKQYKGKYKYEIIVINDGSTDPYTIDLFKDVEKLENVKVIHQENKGATAARNAGCRMAVGEFLLFLDSDNKIKPEYIERGIEQFMSDEKTGVVYGKPIFLSDGSRKGIEPRVFDIDRLLVSNYIDMCAVVRKQAWQDVGGFDESKELRSLQDWEFWLSIYEKKWNFMFIDEGLFEYRIRENSIGGQSLKNNHYEAALQYVVGKHSYLYFTKHKELYSYLNKNRIEIRIGKPIAAAIRKVVKLTRYR